LRWPAEHRLRQQRELMRREWRERRRARVEPARGGWKGRLPTLFDHLQPLRGGADEPVRDDAIVKLFERILTNLRRLLAQTWQERARLDQEEPAPDRQELRQEVRRWRGQAPDRVEILLGDCRQADLGDVEPTLLDQRQQQREGALELGQANRRSREAHPASRGAPAERGPAAATRSA